MAGVFSKQRFGFASETTIEQPKRYSKNPNTVKSIQSKWFLLGLFLQPPPIAR